MRTTGPGQVLFAVSFIGLGILSLGSGDFAMNWQPVPPNIPWREPLAYLSGIMLLGAGLGMFFERARAAATLVLTLNLAVWLVFLRLPPVAVDPANVAQWLGFGETLMLVAAGWILVAPQRARIAQILFGIALLPVGLSHLVYAQQTAALIPAWLPWRVPLAYVTGIAHMAAGVALVSGVRARLAATLEGVMLALFALLVWAPRIAAAPTNRFSATAFLITIASAGAAGIAAFEISRSTASRTTSS